MVYLYKQVLENGRIYQISVITRKFGQDPIENDRIGKKREISCLIIIMFDPKMKYGAWGLL
jgi:hypothetical protein